LKVPAEELRKYLGVRTVDFVKVDQPLAVVETTLA
jgi:hypothetical protein